MTERVERVQEESDLTGLLCVLPVPTPEFGRTVKAAIKTENRQYGWSLTYAELMAVDESDCTWRFASDGAELAFHADVIYWEYT